MGSKSGKRRRRREKRAQEQRTATDPAAGNGKPKGAPPGVDERGERATVTPAAPETATPTAPPERAPVVETPPTPAPEPAAPARENAAPPAGPKPLLAGPASVPIDDALQDVVHAAATPDAPPPPAPPVLTVPPELLQQIARLEQRVDGMNTWLIQWTHWYGSHRADHRVASPRRRRLVLAMIAVFAVVSLLLVVLNRAGYP